MNKFHRFILSSIILSFSFLGFCQEVERVEDFGTNRGNLDMYLYIPNSLQYDTIAEVPLVVALHGCSQSLDNLIEGSGWCKMAEKHRFIVLFPRQKFINNTSLCFNWFREDDFSKYGGESESISNMVHYVQENYPVQDDKVFLYGLSAGAAMGVSLLVNNPDVFNAGAIFAGAPYKIATNPFKAFSVMRNVPEKTIEEWGNKVDSFKIDIDYPKLIVFHGEEDNVVEIQSAIELIKQWRFLHQNSKLSIQEEKNFNGNELVDRISYTDSSQVERIIFYRVQDLGHEIPIDEGTNDKQGGKVQTYTRDIDFYSTYYVAKEFGIIDE